MIPTNRRLFLKVLGLIGLSTASAKASKSPDSSTSKEPHGVLVDTTVCIGCRNCEWACRDAHGGNAGSIDAYEDRTVFQSSRRPNTEQLTVINEYVVGKRPIDVKFQCMHCLEPACRSACIVGAFSKSDRGAVVWDTDKCIGCRYCMVACPFQIPAFQYDQALHPNIMKCDFCTGKTARGERPACVAVCPMEAMTYGVRSELLRIGKERIRKHPERYVDHIFGENEVGGTSWLYLTAADHASLGFPRLKESPAPGVTESIQHGIFAYFIPPVLLYALLGGIMWLRKDRRSPHDGTTSG